MNYFQKIIDIRSSSDPLNAIETISEAVSIKGYNMWLLFCSSVLASIGLDTNSSAVIIGAMLISPLMSPILGIGLSVGIHNRTLLFRSLRNFAAAIFISLIASCLYFLISPFSNPTAEIEARTHPTLLDVMVAFFGGIAGIVSASRSGISNAIPGVAIATALMPPLCTAGYGLAEANWSYFGGALYLFFINAVFISLATFLMVRYLKFPETEFASQRQKTYYNLLFIILTVIVTIPSAYFLYTVYLKETTKQKIDSLVLHRIQQSGNEILKWEMLDKDSSTWIKVYHSGQPLGDSLRELINTSLENNGLAHYELKPLRVNMTKEEVNQLSADVSRQMFQQLQLEQMNNGDNDQQKDSLSYVQLAGEVKTAFLFVDTLYNGWITLPDSSRNMDTLPVVFYTTRGRVTNDQQAQLYNFLKLRLQRDSVLMLKQ